jgi:hypothetical protein
VIANREEPEMSRRDRRPQPFRDTRLKTILICTVVFVAMTQNGCSRSISGSPISNVGRKAATSLPRILFVGDSYTHGRYMPVRGYGTGGTACPPTEPTLVIDENDGQSGKRAEAEPGPWGGIPGIFARFAVEAGLPYEVHIEAISATSLEKNYQAASSVIARQAGWDAVVLQELSTRPLPQSLTPKGNPSNFCDSVQTIETAVHAAASSAKVYLYETWASADLAASLSGSYDTNLTTLVDAYHDVHFRAATRDGHIAGVAPVGDAWNAAWKQGVANANPFNGDSSGLSLWYGIQATNDPPISSADEHHPSKFGAYLSALVLFQTITGTDVRTLGASDGAAQDLGIASDVAVSLQSIASDTAVNEQSTPNDPNTDPCP